MTRRSSASRKRSSLPWGSLGILTSLWLPPQTSAAADDAFDLSGVQDIQAVLRKVEEQVAAGHAISPEEDCGMETWKQVLRLEMTFPASPAVRAALEDFVTRMRTRAVAENSAGKLVVSSDLVAFAEQANRLLEHPTAPKAPVPGGTATEARDVLSLDGHPPQTSLTEIAEIPSERVTDQSGTGFEPDGSAVDDGTGTTIIHPLIETTADAPVKVESPESTPAPGPPRKRRHRPRPVQIEFMPLPPQPPPPPAPRPPLMTRILMWLSGDQ